MNKKGVAVIGATIPAILVIVACTVVAMTFLAFSQGVDAVAIEQLNIIVEGDTYAEYTLGALLSYETASGPVRDIIKSNPISSSTNLVIEEALNDYLKILVEVTYLVDSTKYESLSTEDIKDIMTRSFESAGFKADIKILGGVVWVTATSTDTDDLEGMYQLDITKEGETSTLGKIEEPLNAYVTEEVLLSDTGEKVELKFFILKSKPSKEIFLFAI